MEDQEFARCYRKLIAHYRQTPEESGRQLAAILRRIGTPEREDWEPEVGKREKNSGGNHP